MDQIFVDLIGKPKLNPTGKIVTLIAENFSLLDDQAKFLKATLAIPTEKQLPLDGISKRMIQVGPLHSDIKSQLDNANWTVVQQDSLLIPGARGEQGFHEKLATDLAQSSGRSLIYINDASQIQLALGDKKEWKKFLRLLYKWRHQDKHFVVVFYQQSEPKCSDGTLLRDLEYISDGCIRTKAFRSCYLQSMWFRPVQVIKTLIPPKVETHYYTCKIGKSYWSADLLCFYERNKVTKDHDPDLGDTISKLDVASTNKDSRSQIDADVPGEDALESALHKVGLDDEDDERNLNAATLPYIKAQNPEQSRIFYYPDKDDDVDEEDPDDDLGI